jgi:hydrogenase maturation factor HypF (carbamoyltransferase family)
MNASRVPATPPTCRRCHSEYVKRVSRANLVEHFLSRYYIYPFRCQVCGHRFKVWQRGVAYTRIEIPTTASVSKPLAEG